MADAEEVLVLGECLQGHLAPITGEIVAAGRQLADDLGIGVACGLIGDGIDDTARVAVTLGADRAYVVDDPLLAEFQPELYLEALTKLCRTVSPRVLLMARTSIGRDLAPRLAARLGVPLVQDCLEVKIDASSKQLLATRPVYGGNAHGHCPLHPEPAICDGAPKSVQSFASTGPASGRSDSHPGRARSSHGEDEGG